MYNVQVPPLVRVLKCAVAPSSSELSWETITGLLRIKSSQVNWKPLVKPSPSTTTMNPKLGALPSFSMLKMYTQYVEENNDEAGKLPPLSSLLVDALHTYARKGFCIVTQPRLLDGYEYKSDYVIAIVKEIVQVSFLC